MVMKTIITKLSSGFALPEDDDECYDDDKGDKGGLTTKIKINKKYFSLIIHS